jgi:hypothetical protein
MAFGDFTVTRASTKLRIGSNGLYGSVANNVPAFEFNTDGTYRGLLVEPGATNLALRSQEFNEASWAKTRGTVTANTTVAPDGATTADTLTSTETNVNGFLVNQVFTVVTATTYTVSVFLKKGTSNFSVFTAFDGSANGVRQWFNLNTGVVASSNAFGTGWTKSGARITDVGGGWYRCEFAFVTSGTALTTVIYPSVSADLGFGATIGDIGILWQAQLETGSVATSPIVTTAGTASRVADVVSLTGASSLIGQTSGTIFAEIVARNFNVSPGPLRRVVTISDGTTSNRIGIASVLSHNNRYQGVVVNSVGGTTAQIIQSADIAENTVIKLALGYAVDDIAFYINGSSIGTDTSSAVPACSRIDIGNQLGGDQFINGHIRSVALFPTRLTNTQLASLTTL